MFVPETRLDFSYYSLLSRVVSNHTHTIDREALQVAFRSLVSWGLLEHDEDNVTEKKNMDKGRTKDSLLCRSSLLLLL